MQLETLDLIVFIVVTVGSVLFGASFYSKNKTSAQFTAGDANFPSWVVGMSIFATFVSSISFLALPGSAYSSNWNALVFSFSIPVAAILAAKFFVPLYREVGSISAYNYLETRFGRWARVYASLCYLLTQLMRTGAILLLLALPIHALLGFNVRAIIVVTGLAVTIYSVLGGIRAAIWTDVIQGTVLVLGAITCALILTFTMPEGPSQLFEIAKAHDKFSLGNFGPSVTESTFWVVLIYGLFINLQNYGIDQNYIQRYMVTDSVQKAKNSTLFGALLYVPVSVIFFYIGTGLFAYYTAQPELLPPELHQPGKGDMVFPFFIVNVLPVGLTGLLIAAIFSAGMSTISTSLNSSATIILTDYYRMYINKNASERASMTVLYLSSAVIGFFGVLIALSLVGVESVLDAWWALASVFSGGMLGLFLLAFLSKKVRRIDAIVGVICGVLVITWMSLSPLTFNEGPLVAFRSPFHANLTIVIGTLVIFLVGFISMKFFSKRK